MMWRYMEIWWCDDKTNTCRRFFEKNTSQALSGINMYIYIYIYVYLLYVGIKRRKKKHTHTNSPNSSNHVQSIHSNNSFLFSAGLAWPAACGTLAGRPKRSQPSRWEWWLWPSSRLAPRSPRGSAWFVALAWHTLTGWHQREEIEIEHWTK